jgi:hypothetical protein
MQTFDYDTPSLSLVSWARTTRPVRLGSLFKSDATNQPTNDATDTVLFGCSTVALVLAPLVALIVVLFG